MNPVIELDNLKVKFGKLEALRGLTGTFSGHSIGLLGPNGAGKTTLIHTLLGFHPPAEGTGRIFGMDIRTQAKEIRSQIGYMPENESFVSGLSCVQFVAMMAELTGIPSSSALERAHEALFFVGLGEARYRQVHTFSTGMKQLAKLAQAIVHGPSLLFLDEPTNGLDPPARVRMIRMIKEITKNQNIHLVLSSHLLRDVEECCEEVLILKKGEIAVYCDLEKERRANRKFVELETRGPCEDFLEAVSQLGCEWAQAGNRRYKMVLPENFKISKLYELAIQSDLQLRRMSYKRDSLEDIFLKAMGTENGSL
jgi:ABC-2 type transport system ATP-binding protein